MDDKNKFSKIKVETPKGVRYITYKPVPGVKADELVCETRCPYGKICDKLRDPRHPEDKNLCFMHFYKRYIFHNSKERLFTKIKPKKEIK